MDMKNLGLACIVVGILLAVPVGATAAGWHILLTVLPYGVFVVFLGGFVYRVIVWGRSPVPFRVPTTCGQQASLPWIKPQPLESPDGRWGVIGRMACEVLCFRSLLRNTKGKIVESRPVYASNQWLWFFGLLFHWSLLVIVVRHLRLFIEPVPGLISALTALDGFFEIGIPTLYLSDAAVLTGLTFLFLRRVLSGRLRYISLVSDYFALLLLLGIVCTGVLMRHFFPADLVQVKDLALGWVSLAPVVPTGSGVVFSLHLFLVCVLLAWFPFSKLMHLGGVFLSPTRNLANNSRRQRHINPWNAPVKVHTYAEYEDEFRDKMKAAGLPLEKE